MRVLSINEPIGKKSANLFNDPHIFVKKRRGLAGTEDSVHASLQKLVDYPKKIKEGLNNFADSIRTNRITIIMRQKWEEEQLYGVFKRQTGEISHEKTWKWRRKETLRENLNLFWLKHKTTPYRPPGPWVQSKVESYQRL